MARTAARPAELFFSFDRGFYPGLSAMRDGQQLDLHNSRSSFAGRRRWRIAALESGDIAGRFPARETGPGNDSLRDCGAAGAGGWADARRVYHHNYGWQWIFYLNVPVGLFAFLMCR